MSEVSTPSTLTIIVNDGIEAAAPMRFESIIHHHNHTSNPSCVLCMCDTLVSVVRVRVRVRVRGVRVRVWGGGGYFPATLPCQFMPEGYSSECPCSLYIHYFRVGHIVLPGALNSGCCMKLTGERPGEKELGSYC